MTDRELLENAAKAAEIQLLWTYGGQPVNVPTLFKGMGSDEVWNPLTDDGDALRLAVTLGIGLEFDFDRIDAISEVARATEYLYEKPAPTDRYAATRRAIVRAAAEIGKEMK